MRVFALVAAVGLGMFAATAREAQGCSACAALFAKRKTMRGVLRPVTEGRFIENWQAKSGKASGLAPKWQLLVGGRVVYLDLGDNKELLARAEKLNGMEVEVLGDEVAWTVHRSLRPGPNGITIMIGILPQQADGLRVIEMSAVR
jgi:hypothetical protein